MVNNKLKVKVRFLNTTKGDIEDHNLINNNGLDMLDSYYVCDVFTNLQWGTGNRQNARSSDGVTLTQSGTSVTSDIDFFTQDDATNKRLIVFNDGTQANILTYISATQVTVAETQAVAAQTATVFYVEEVALENGFATYNTYVAGENGSTQTYVDNILTIEDKRTFDLGIAGATFTAKEFGWGPSSGIGVNVFGRIVKEVTWAAGATVQIEVTVTRVIDCNIVTIPSLPLTGAAFSATSRIMFGNAEFYINGSDYRSTVTSAGATLIGTHAAVSLMEPRFTGTQLEHSISETASSLDLSNVADTTAGDSQVWVLDTYVAGNYSRSFTAQFTGETFVSSVWRNISMWMKNQTSQFRILFDANQSFDGQLSDLVIKMTWGRN